MTLQATPDMRRVVDGLIRDGRITRSAVEYARANDFTDADIIRTRESVRLSQAKLEITSRAHLYKPAPAIENPSDPTPEQKAKGGVYLASRTVGKGEQTPVRQYRLRSVIEIHADKFEMSHRTAYDAFIQDADLHQRVRVADLNSRGGGGGVSRIGGLGDVPPEIRDRHNRYEWVVARLTAKELEVADALVLCVLTRRNGARFSPEEFGALLYPMLADKSFHRGAAVNGFMHFVDHLVELYHHPMCPRVRRKEPQQIGESP